MAQPAGDPISELTALGIPAAAHASFRTTPQETPIYPENWDAARVFDAMRTQWRHDFSGKSGLDYQALPVVMSFISVADEKDTFDAIRIMEAAIIRTWAEQRARKRT